MRTSPERECWLSGQVEVRPSRIAGRGLVAVTDLEEGAVVARLGGRIVSDATLRRLIETSETYVDSVSVLEDRNLVLPAGTPNHFGNHSCDPTLWWVDPFSLATRRGVSAGTEITVDYGTLTDDPDFRMSCDCGATSCRGVVTGVDWTRPELQERYGDQWVPVLRDRIRQAQGFIA